MNRRTHHSIGGRTRRGLTAATCAALLATSLSTAAVAQEADPRGNLAPGTDVEADGNAFTVPNADAETVASNMEHLANRPKPRWTNAAGQDSAAGAFNYSNIGSDLAFTGDHAISGNYRGFGVYDISDPAAPVLTTTVNCPGGQGDVSVYGDLLFMSVESTAGRTDCSTSTASPVFRGVRIFDISDLANPQYIAGVQTCRGSHTHTIVEDPSDPANVYVYVSGTAGVRSAAQLAGCTNPTNANTLAAHLDANGDPISTSRFLVEVIKVPLATPADAAVVNEARLMADEATGSPAGLWPGGNHGEGTQSTAATDACHDITAYPEIGLAAGACEGNGLLIDISDPADPQRIDEVLDPNFAYWHSATFSNDGTKVVFTDEWGGGVGARCRTTDPDNWGANAIFDLVDGKLEFASYYKIPNVQNTNETCVAHNGSLVPVPGRDIMVQAWYEGGASVFDFTDSANPVEIAYFDRGPYAPQPTFHQGGYWSIYWYNGHIYGNEIFLGFDSWKLTPSADLSEVELAAMEQVQLDEFNPQAQTRFTWPASFTTVRAWHAAAQRQGVLASNVDRNLTRFIDRAELAANASNSKQRNNDVAQLRAVSNQLGSSDVEQDLKQALLELADELAD
ncbi:LVIVD repeat-containing protein [Egicoccus halophilus]|uniref:LVIVD repeat-containing protein n=1 Tax=Egicoccus halophilus TaxID=1670830 RepID=A0A8J3A8T7_9ACTN|nr:hypothetical protein [Egicoccus halophilus]GGI06839.1 hypothetical protein GCM10011354_21100 [Egicoccus halophilus]